MSFLSLPSELRYQIYAIIALPDVTPFSKYRGLYLSCRQIKADLDSEWPKAFDAHLASISKRTPCIHLSASKSGPISARQHVRLTLDPAIQLDASNLKNLFAPSFHLYVPSLTLAFGRTTGPRDLSRDGWTIIDIFRHNASVIKAPVVKLEFPREYAEHHIGHVLPRVWTCEWVVGDDQTVCVWRRTARVKG